MTVEQDLRARGLRGLCGGAVHLPGDPAYDMARTPWNVRVSDLPAAVAYPATPDEVAEVLRAAAAARAGGGAAGHRARGPGPGRAAGRRRAAPHRRDDRAQRRPRPAHGPRRRRRALGGRGRGGGQARPGDPAPLVTGRRGRGLLAGGRHRVVRTAPGTAVQRRHRGRAGPRRRHVRPRDRRTTTRSCSGRSAAVARRSVSSCALEFEVLPIATVVAGYLAWDWTAVESVLPRVGRVVRRRARGGDDVVPAARRAGRWTTLPSDVRGTPAGGRRRGGAGRRRLRRATCWRRCGRWSRRSTPPHGCPRPSWSGCTWSPRGRPRPTRAAPWSRRSRTPRSTP